MPDDNVLDFDTVFAKEQVPAKKIKLYGKTWEIPGSLPASIALTVGRLTSGDATLDSLSNVDVLEIAEQLLGESNLAEWSSRGLSLEQLTRVFSDVLQMHVAGLKNKPSNGTTVGLKQKHGGEGSFQRVAEGDRRPQKRGAK